MTMAAYSWKKPECLIENTAAYGLKINQKTLGLLQDIQVPVYVVSIVGQYRTGKSYLLNLLAGQQSGFDLGSTVQSKTKGIWAWCRPHPKKKNQCLLLLDTEGLGDVEKGDRSHDKKVFALSVLLSSTFVYNTMGRIDQDTIDSLHFVTELTENIKVKAATTEEEGTDFETFFPEFICAIRDFILDLEWEGQPITSDQYLEKALMPKKGMSKTTTSYNRPRDCIRQYFPNRKCFTFPRPVKEEALLKALESVRREELDTTFIKMSDKFAAHVYDKTKAKKTIDGKLIAGRMLGNMAKCYVEAIQNGGVPCIESALETTAKLENFRAIKESVELYHSGMLDKILLPTASVEELSALHHACEDTARTHFMKIAILDQDHTYQNQMMVGVQKHYDEFTKQNEAISQEVCNDLLNELYGPVLKSLESGTYAQPGGYELYRGHMEALEETFFKKPKKGIMAEQVFNHFMHGREAEYSSLLAADKNLTLAQKKTEEAGRQARESKRQKIAAENDKQRAEQKAADQQKSHEENMLQLQKKWEEDKKLQMEEIEDRMNQRLKDQQELLKEGFDERAAHMMDDIKKLQQLLKKKSALKFGEIGKKIKKKLAKAFRSDSD